MLHLISPKKNLADTSDFPPPGFGVSSGMKDPLLAPASDYFHYITPQDNARVVLNVPLSTIQDVYTAKTGAALPAWRFGAVGALAPADSGLINGLRAGEFTGFPFNKRWGINAGIPAGGQLMYPSMTWFFVVRPKGLVTNQGYLFSDYGSDLNKVCYLKIGNGVGLEVNASMRDTAGNIIACLSGATVLSVNTDYLIVAKMDGSNQRIDLWIDGATSAFNAVNGAYINTTTWEGLATPTSIPVFGLLSNFLNTPYQGDLGAVFFTKTALSNGDINLYASYLANIWGTVWTAI